MSKWLLRGIVFAALMVVVRLLQGAMISAWETQALWISIGLVSVFTIVAFVWGVLDGQSDARSQPDPDRRNDLAMAWLLAGLFAGIVSGLVSWIIGQFYDNIYVESIYNEVSTFAAFTALLMFVAGVCGVTLGRWLVDRKAPPAPSHHHGDERADTDVFAAVAAAPAEASDGTTEVIEATPETKPES